MSKIQLETNPLWVQHCQGWRGLEDGGVTPILAERQIVIKSGVPCNHEVAETPVGKAELLNKYFCSVFLPTTYGLNKSGYTTSSSITDMEISQIEVTVDEVMERLS